MKLIDVLNKVALGEMKDIYVGSGRQTSKTRSKLISYVNEALRALYTDFPLSTKEVVIRLRNDMNVYTINSQYALSNGDSPVPLAQRYIEDSETFPFRDDILRIDEIFNILGITQDVNNRTSAYGISVVGFDQIQVPYPKEGERLVVTYQALPSEICCDAPDDYYVHLPLMFLELLAAYIGYLSYSGMNSPTAAAKGGELYGKYTVLKDRMQNNNVFNQNNTPYNTMFEERGFV